MPELTLELVEAKQTELAAMIEKLRLASKAAVLKIPAAEISLLPGEWYAGAVLNEDGTIKHHLIVVDSDNEGRTFEQVQAWAKERGYSAPTRQESRLIVAHRYERLAGMSAFWTCEEHENAAYAWTCHLHYGIVDHYGRSAELGGVAVRRVNP